MLILSDFYGLVIRNKENEIIGIAKRNYKDDLFFTCLDEYPDNSIQFFSNEQTAKRSFSAKASRKTAYISEKLAKEIDLIYGYPLSVIYVSKYILSFDDFKKVVETANLRLTVSEI